MKKLAENIWIVDGEAVSFLGLPFSTRMTIIRLQNGVLWVHSPIKLTATLQDKVQQLGPVQYLIAPNHLHHLFLPDWQSSYPEAICCGTDQVIKKRSDLSFNFSLNKEQQWPWQGEIAQCLFTGSAVMEECVFFHRSSRVLVVTDLVENFSGKTFNAWQRGVASVVGILSPNGKMPLDWRLSFMFNRAQARQHFAVIIDWDPWVLVMAHGLIVEKEAVAFLRRAFRWLG